MRFRSIENIIISPTRQRREFDTAALNELAESIQSKGLLHPIVVRAHGDECVLVAGERRLRAVRDIWDLGGSFTYDTAPVPAGQIPVVFMAELSPLDYEEAEYEENSIRTDLTWQERAAAILRLAGLRKKQAEAAGSPAPTLGAIALEVRGSGDSNNSQAIRQDLIVAGHLSDPDIKGAKSSAEAFKILRRKEETRLHADHAARVGLTFSAASHRAICADSLAWMAEAEPEQFDVILTDPPYGMGADEFGDSGGKAAGAHGYADDKDNFLKIMEGLVTQSFRITKSQAHLYVFCDIDWFARMRLWFGGEGWKVHRTPIIWHKPNNFRAPWPDQGPQRKYELCLYAVKGDKLVTKMCPDLVSYPSDENLGHSAQKPVGLFLDLLHRSCRAGDSVLDPFAGTGTIFPAAHELKCRATGIEMDSTSYGIALKRLEGLK